MKKNQLLYKQKKYSNSVIKNNSYKIKENNINIEAKGKKSNSHNKKNIKISDNIEQTYELIESKRGGINLIQDGKYILHKFRPLDSGYSEFRCTKYKFRIKIILDVMLFVIIISMRIRLEQILVNIITQKK